MSGAPAVHASVLRFAPAMVLLAAAIADSGRYADTDLWGHLWFGKLLLDRGPHAGPDPYSYAPHLPDWLHHEWLSEALMAWLYAVGGVIGLKLWKFVCSAATMVLLVVAQAETAAPGPLQLIVLLAVAAGLIPYMQFRPLLFSYVFTAVAVALVSRDNYRGKPMPWLIVPGFALWSNLHGSFFVGLGILGAYAAACGVIDLVAGRGIRRGGLLAAITLASTVATLATPYGVDTWRAIAVSLANPLTRHVMADWRPLLTVLAAARAESHGGAVFLWLALAIIVALPVSLAIALPAAEDWPLIVVAILVDTGAFMAVRNVPLALIATTPPLTRQLAAVGRRRAKGEAAGTAATVLQSLSWRTQALAGLTATLMLLSGGLLARKLPTAASYPVGAVAYLDSHRLHGNILNYFAWGQYLIWHESPVSKVFIDGRYDLVYPPAIVTDYLAFYNDDRDAQRVLNRFPHDFVLLPPSAPAVRLMLRQADWHLLYRDRNAVLFARGPQVANPNRSRAVAIAAADATRPVADAGSSGPGYFP